MSIVPVRTGETAPGMPDAVGSGKKGRCAVDRAGICRLFGGPLHQAKRPDNLVRTGEALLAPQDFFFDPAHYWPLLKTGIDVCRIVPAVQPILKRKSPIFIFGHVGFKKQVQNAGS